MHILIAVVTQNLAHLIYFCNIIGLILIIIGVIILLVNADSEVFVMNYPAKLPLHILTLGEVETRSVAELFKVHTRFLIKLP